MAEERKKNEHGKAAACIMMLQLMSNGRVWKISELADRLGTNPRNIIEYRKTLEEIGYYIENRSGKNGGYQLVFLSDGQSKIFPSLPLTDDEKKAIIEASSYMNKRNDFLWAKEYDLAMGKVISSIARHDDADDYIVINNRPLSMSAEEIKARYKAIDRCINNKTVLNMDFLSNDNVVRNRNVHPYKFFIYNGAWFFIGYCESVGGVRVFKLNRIEGFTVTERKFRKLLSYNERDYFDENGFKTVGDWRGENATTTDGWIRIKLRFTGRPAMYVKEYVYGRNQTVTPIDKDHTVLECEMQYHYNTLQFVLGFGADCEVLEPEWLKTEVLEQAKQLLNRQ